MFRKSATTGRQQARHMDSHCWRMIDDSSAAALRVVVCGSGNGGKKNASAYAANRCIYIIVNG